ncbi:MAG: hypothetical protein WC817_03480 [Patescibacteria group bacterium]|jgi:hypothetical protein
MAEVHNDNPVLNESWFRWATFWINNRERIRSIAIVITIGAEAALLIFSGYSLLNLYVFSSAANRQVEQALSQGVDSTDAHRIMAPKPISISAAVVLPGSSKDGRYDALVKFFNSNPNWVAWITFQAEDQSKQETVLVLNNEERFAIAVGAAPSPASAPPITILGTKWMRLRNPEATNQLKPHFVVSDVSFESGQGADRTGTGVPGRVMFTVTNESINGFWSAGFTVVLLQGDRAVAAEALMLDQLKAGEQRKVAINLYTTIVGVSDVLVVPNVDIVDQGNFMRGQAEPIRF